MMKRVTAQIQTGFSRFHRLTAAVPAILLLMTGWHPASAEPLHTVVKYVSTGSVYVGAGSEAGVQKGDAGRVLRGDSLVATLRVEFVAATTSSCSLVETQSSVRVGDSVILDVTSPDTTGATKISETTTGKAGPTQAVSPARSRVRDQALPRANRLYGRVALQYYVQNDLSGTNDNVREPGLRLRLRVDNLAGSPYTLNVRGLLRRSERTRTLPGSPASDWTNRIYEVSLLYNDPESPLHSGAGRITSNRIAGIGILDGALAEYRAGRGTTFGLFGGTQPDYTRANVSLNRPQAGAFASYERSNDLGDRAAGTLALAGQYQQGQISREFLYEQTSFSKGLRFSFYQSAEISVNRGWRYRAEGSRFKVSNLLLNVRFIPLRGVNADFGYDNRTNIRTYENRTVPDSLFDDALRQGWRFGFGLHPAPQTRLFARGVLRLRRGDSESTRSYSLGAIQGNLFGSGVALTARLNGFRNRYTSGLQPSLTVSRYLFRILYSSLEFGRSQYNLAVGGGSIASTWTRLRFDGSLTDHIYASVSLEAARGDDLDANRAFLELGYRF